MTGGVITKLRKFCGGPGSGRPGPCPQNKPHIETAARHRAAATQAQRHVAKWERVHARAKTNHQAALTKHPTGKAAIRTQAALKRAEAEHGKAKDAASQAEALAQTHEAAAGLAGGKKGGVIGKPKKEAAPTAPDAPAATEAHVTIEPKAAANARKLLGRDLPPEDFARLVGARPGAQVSVKDAYGSVVISVQHPDYNATRFIEEGDDGQPVLINHDISIGKEAQGKGLATQILADQVEGAARAGIGTIKAHATGNYSTIDSINGYYTWPRLGYDAKLTADQRQAMPAEFRSAKTLQKLFALPGGAEAWKRHGASVNVEFDTRSGSVSRKVLAGYLERKKAAAHAERDFSEEDDRILDEVWDAISTDFAEDAPPAGPAPQQVALPGSDGERAEHLLRAAKRQGTLTLAALARSAVSRLLAGGNPARAARLFSDAERQRLADVLAATTATADLLGRSRIRLRLRKAREQFAEVDKFCMVGENAHKPGPCPEGKDSSATLPSVAGPSSSAAKAKAFREGKVVWSKRLKGGANESLLVDFEDKSTGFGVWKPKSGEEPDYRNDIPGGTYYHREAAAYSVATAIGLDDLVPVTIERQVEGWGEGSVQQWAEDTEAALDIEEAAMFDGGKDHARAAAFDLLVGNTDRHEGNWLLQGGTKIVLIDHGLAFTPNNKEVAPTAEFPSVLIEGAAKRSLPIPAQVLEWDEGKITTAMQQHQLGEREVAAATRRLQELKRVAQAKGSFDKIDYGKM